VTVESVDDIRYGFGVGAGYSISPECSVEIGYLDLKQVDVEFSSTQTISELDDVIPESGEGVTLSGLYKYALDDRDEVSLCAGVYSIDRLIMTPQRVQTVTQERMCIGG